MIAGAVLVLMAAARSARPPDACQVLTRREVAAVQGEPYQRIVLTTRGEISQCFYQLPTFSKSISLDMIREGGREFWEEHVDAEEHDGDQEEPEEAKPPVRVEGIGDEALWSSSRVAGSLYVRKGDRVLRVSVGGPGTEAQKLEKSKKLAAKALRRM